MKILHIVGARPNFMKAAPVIAALAHRPAVEQVLVHTGQHYDANMSDVFFDELGLPAPDVHLGVGSGTHAQQTARVMEAIEPVLVERQPDWVVVVGDVNSTVAAALVAAKLGLRVAHVEAGLRSFDRTMPEELNRIVTDHLADRLFTTEPSGGVNLRAEGIPEERIRFVGNVMIDTLVRLLPRAAARRAALQAALDVPEGGYVLVTLHRPSNVDDAGTLREVLLALGDLAHARPVIFPVHPRTRRRIDELGLALPAGVRLLEPQGYLDFLALMTCAALVLTDSGGVQEETTYLGVPCVTARPNTERPVTLAVGANRLAASTRAALRAAAAAALAAPRPAAPRRPELWDGHAAERIAAVLVEEAA
jgi:UDP-N-acetylglucosamine 2-epimerase (non-hydrolysing)